ncbi:amidohydrolase [Roseobacter ponti]|uniref:Amidohydrolase family protein n=1 Tax=Roseobacter ponti TaxID=1891787 RepID=A0A858SYM0_9RHOB|nr:amidohydrolase family protein [Roseobacter ponti]QJF51956.1 amidohydrolase family protein [Roseobacter ponti]
MALSPHSDRRGFLAGSSAACLAGLVPTGAWAREAAEIIFSGGPIITMDPNMPRAEAVAVTGGRILAVGGRDEIDGLRGPSTQVVDLDGRTLMPGLIEPHMHTSLTTLLSFTDVSIFAVNSFDEVLAKLRAAVGQTAPGEWVFVANFDPMLTPGAQIPTLSDLNALSPDNPFFMLESNGHVAYSNSMGFAELGITRDTPDPATARYVRDANGDLTGRIEEPPAYMPFLSKTPTPTQSAMMAAVRGLFDQGAALGLTAVQDMSVGALTNSGNDIGLLRAVIEGGCQVPCIFQNSLAWPHSSASDFHGRPDDEYPDTVWTRAVGV